MGYKYYQAGIPTLPTSASQAWLNDFDAQLSYQWENSTDVYTIKEEKTFASGSYIDVSVRINRGINSYTGAKLGDDFKTILFKDRNHNVDIGLKYLYDSSYWITINTEKLKNLGCSVTVRRANNCLRWMSGSTIMTEEACVEYDFKNPRFDIPKNDVVTEQAYIRVYCQQNSKTETITPNQRFLFGNPNNWTTFRVLAVRNFLNQETLDNTSSKLMVLEVQEYQGKSDNDDLVNGIADRYAYTVSGSSSAVNNVVVEPANGYVLEGSTQVFDARLYSGSTVLSGSFVFSVSGSMVPIDHYAFSSLTANTFSVTNNEMYLDYPLNVLCSGSSGSRVFPVSLRGAW
jgi:hypothetical protein